MKRWGRGPRSVFWIAAGVVVFVGRGLTAQQPDSAAAPVTLEQAIGLLQAQAAKAKDGGKAKKGTRSAKKAKAQTQEDKPASGRRRAATSE